MKYLVTGAGGFIGSHVVEQLLGGGHTVCAFVRYTSREAAGFLQQPDDGVTLVRGDLRDSDAVEEAMKGCDSVIHLGALIGIPYSFVHPRETFDTNVTGTLNVLSSARKLGVRRVVHISSSEVYGTAKRVPIDEDHPLAAQSPYAASKIGADKIAESFGAAFGTPVVTVRPFNTYGPRQSARAVIPTIISQALRGEKVALGNLAPTRDFTFVTDTADAIVRASYADGVEGKVINLGTSREISIGDLVGKIGVLMGFPISVVSQAQRQRVKTSEVERLLSDNTLAGRLLGWSPLVGLDEGLLRTIAWIRDNLHLYSRTEYAI